MAENVIKSELANALHCAGTCRNLYKALFPNLRKTHTRMPDAVQLPTALAVANDLRDSTFFFASHGQSNSPSNDASVSLTLSWDLSDSHSCRPSELLS